MSSPRLFCPAFSSSQGTSRKRKRSGADFSEAGGAFNEGGVENRKQASKGKSLGDDHLPNQGPLQRQEDLSNHGLVGEAETTDEGYSSESETGTSEASSAPLISPSSSQRRPSLPRRPVSGPPRSDGPRQQHLAAVSAILHRCLLQGDYLRASRAWALLLRSEMNGHSMDVRNQGRWGIGAEILLQNGFLQRRDHLRGDRGYGLEDHDETSTTNTKVKYSERLRPAQDYYDRLIVQYPHRKRSKNAIGPLEFYPVLFGLRVFSEQRNHGNLLQSLQEKHSDDENDMKDVISSESGSTSPKNSDSEFRQLSNLLESSVTRGKEMASQLDELLSSPPYSDDIRLRNLRSMIGLWIENLLASPYFEKAPMADHLRDT